jgi:putative heme-binding domain-containing protein
MTPALRQTTLFMLLACSLPARAQTLDADLLREGAPALARAARRDGNAGRGAVLFHQPHVGCAKCHAVDGGPSLLGPDLTKFGKDATDEHVVESVLAPSKVIRQGFEAVTVTTADGKAVTGLLVEDGNESIILREVADAGRLMTVRKRDVEQRSVSPHSVMPAGLPNTLTGRAEFLDLVRYLFDIRDGGLARARELQPPPAAYALQLPEYEGRIDHAGIIGTLNQDSLRRGDAIYHRVCASCHGTLTEVGSLPTAPRFAAATLKNGSDPFAMYQTLTRGYGMMTPQVQLVPRQKYDVIHYIREGYFKPHNPSQYVKADRAYLSRLPKGDTRGPTPAEAEPWAEMDYGPFLTHTYEAGTSGANIAYKGVAVRLDPGPGGVARGRAWVVFDHDTLRVAAGWAGTGFIDWNSIQFTGRHAVHPRLVGDVQFANPTGPGWADPATGRFDDPRLRGRDGRPYGPLPRTWAHYKGLYLHGERVVFAYTVGDATVLESPGWEGDAVIYTRTLNIGRSSRDLLLRVAADGAEVAFAGPDPLRLEDRDGFTLLHIPAAATPVRAKLFIAKADADRLRELARRAGPVEDLSPLTHGGPTRYPEVLHTPVDMGKDDGPFAVDVLVLPVRNPWKCQVRLTGFDFYPGGAKAAVCSWDGDVWLVSGFDNLAGGLTWRRIASGLFQPLGLKIVDGLVYVTCRDQLVRLRDLNGDGEADFYEAFNNDHQVTEHFHEFAMGLQTDADGNFYYAKSARHALPALVPHHGTLLRVSKDGARTDILATGFRAANGVCLNPDGTFFVTDQEGHWMPKNRINRVRPGGFYGNMFGYHDVTDSSDAAMEQPLCWITNRFDRSPAELLWVASDRWGPLQGRLLNLSYGYGQIYVVPHEKVGDRVQGGMCALPLPPFPTGIMRGRFHPGDGQLYVCGMYSWAGSRQQPGGFYRVRSTGKPAYLPVELKATAKGLAITFSGDLDPSAAADVRNYAVTVWGLKRTAKYGSPHVDERSLRVARATLAEDGRTVLLDIPEIGPTMGMETRFRLRAKTGEAVNVTIHHTIHELGE